MEIIGDTAHRMLAYVEAVNRQGYHLTVKEFEAYASGWEPSVTTVGTGSEFGYTWQTFSEWRPLPSTETPAAKRNQ